MWEKQHALRTRDSHRLRMPRIIKVSGLVQRETQPPNVSTASKLYVGGRFRGSDQARTVVRKEKINNTYRVVA